MIIKFYILLTFPYLGVRFCYNGKFNLTNAHLIVQAKKAKYSIIKKSRKLSLPISLQLHLFDTMVTLIVLYGSEVWGCESVTLLDKFQIQFCTQI